jgi:hypothetical protein
MMKHNKKKNIAIIFDILLLEYAKCKMQNESEKMVIIENILKNHFSKSSVLLKEYSFYNILSTIDIKMNKDKAYHIFNEVKSQFDKMDKVLLSESLDNLKNDINAAFDKDFYENFVNNYKIYATIYNVLHESNNDTYSKIKLQDKIINNMLLENKSDSNDYLFDVNTIRYNKEFEKFEEKVKDLLPEQKTFLFKYINAHANDFDFLVYLNEEVSRCKNIINENKNKFIDEEEYKIISEKIHKIPMKNFINKEDLTFVLELQQLVNYIR